MKKCRCKCRKKAERGGRAMLAPTAKDQEVKRLKEERDKAIKERDKAIEELEFWTAAFAHEPEDVAALKKEKLQLKRDKQELLEELRRMKHENEMLWNYRANRERKGY